MIERRIWIVLYIILMLGSIYFGVHLAIFLNKPDQSVYQELRRELEDPTPRAEYLAKYKKFLERKQSPSSGSVGTSIISISSEMTAFPGLKKNTKGNKKLVMK